MSVALKAFFAIYCFALLGTCGSSSAFAQLEATNMAMKSGETVELGPLYWLAKCSSVLKATPVAEILEGPEEITVSVKEAMVLPRSQGCAKEVKGGTLSVTSKAVKEKKEGSLIIRVKYATKDGERQATRAYNVSIFP
jgi:hypothetical protein